jgi:NADH dehydrogenase FAD-containing subunit
MKQIIIIGGGAAGFSAHPTLTKKIQYYDFRTELGCPSES